MNRLRHWKLIALVATLVAVTGWTVLPASAHVGSWAHNWTIHIKPRTDARYYTKTTSDGRYYTKAASEARYLRSTLPLGHAMSGVWILAGASGEWSAAAINFVPKLPGSVTSHYVTTPTAECPGAGQAAAGHLCLYEDWNYHEVFSSLTPGGPNTGFILYMQGNAVQANARGTWTVRAPLVASRPVAPAPRLGSGTSGR
jgi:hypothetical protein